MQTLCLRPRPSERPQRLVLIDLAPRRGADFRAALSGRKHEFEGSPEGAHFAARPPNRANFPVEQNTVALAIPLCSGSPDRSNGRVVDQLVFERPEKNFLR